MGDGAEFDIKRDHNLEEIHSGEGLDSSFVTEVNWPAADVLSMLRATRRRSLDG